MKYLIQTSKIVNSSEYLEKFDENYHFYNDWDSKYVDTAEILDSDDILVFHSKMKNGERVYILSEGE